MNGVDRHTTEDTRDIRERDKEEALEDTLFMIKPDAVRRGKIGAILAEVEKAGFEILGIRMVRLQPAEARRFYAVHEGKPFLDDLVAFMSSGPAVPVRPRRENAIRVLRDLIGATRPQGGQTGHDPGAARRRQAVQRGPRFGLARVASVEIPFFF